MALAGTTDDLPRIEGLAAIWRTIRRAPLARPLLARPSEKLVLLATEDDRDAGFERELVRGQAGGAAGVEEL